ncbi:hypothetical protein AG1IA_00459 [Rhizoctonia solani AG-1 IA]|uniref:Uncharacterized protein n=1 Tax=Thanatephorus cucumeris (strain AG1-IA) TaxID=983506 RepID=L8X5L8_THACA|nr:hypothetical protein AG1IA_00459 [Rhizoctonia solani AG-1 IA]
MGMVLRSTGSDGYCKLLDLCPIPLYVRKVATRLERTNPMGKCVGKHTNSLKPTSA